MLKNVLLILFFLMSFILLIRYLKVKQQIKKIEKQLQNQETYLHGLSIELFDKDIKGMTLEINRIIEQNNQMLIEMEKGQLYLRNSIADISHDMRTPLTSIIGYLQLLKKSHLDESQIKDLNVALEKAQYLKKLLMDFFELSALNAREEIVQLKKVDLADLLTEAILENVVEFNSQKIEPIFKSSDMQALVLADTEMLQRVLQNIISNCLTYSSGHVLFNISTNEHIVLRIENPVNNIEQIDIEHVFERFYKNDISRNEKGTGLGLPITQLLMEKMGGSISAHIKGDLFVIELVFKR